MPGALKEKLNYYRQHWFLKNVATLQIGSFTGTFVQAVVGVLMARLLQPELFGIYSLAFGLAAIGGILVSSGTQDAATSLTGTAYASKDKEETKNTLAFFLKIGVVAGLLTVLVSFFLPAIAEKLYHNSRIGIYASIIILASIFSSLFFALSQIGLQVTGKIKALAVLVVSDQVLRYSLSLLLVLAGWRVLGAVSGHLIGTILIFTVLIFFWQKIKKNSELPDLKEIIAAVKKVRLKKYLGFTAWVTLDSNLASLYMALPIIITGIYVVPSEVTFFKLAFGLMNLALSLLGPVSVLLNVEFPKMRVEDYGNLKKNFIKVSLYSILLSSVLTLGTVIVSPLVFRFLYGVNFLPSIKYVFGLGIYGALFGIGVGLGPMWRAINKVKVSILINIVVLGFGVPLGMLLVKNWGTWGAVMMVTLWFTVSHFVSFIYLAKKIGRKNQNIVF